MCYNAAACIRAAYHSGVSQRRPPASPTGEQQRPRARDARSCSVPAAGHTMRVPLGCVGTARTCLSVVGAGAVLAPAPAPAPAVTPWSCSASRTALGIHRGTTGESNASRGSAGSRRGHRPRYVLRLLDLADELHRGITPWAHPQHQHRHGHTVSVADYRDTTATQPLCTSRHRHHSRTPLSSPGSAALPPTTTQRLQAVAAWH